MNEGFPFPWVRFEEFPLGSWFAPFCKRRGSEEQNWRKYVVSMKESRLRSF